MVTAGPSYDQSKHQVVHVNQSEATVFENEFVKAKVNVRIRSFHGLPSGSPTHSPYFDDAMHEKDQYSVAFSFVPKKDLPSVDTVWGNDFDHPIRERLPPGFNTAFRIVKEFIDPGLSCDAYADAPWLYGPSLSCWFAFRIGDRVDLDKGQDFPAPGDEVVMAEGAEGSGEDVRRNAGLPSNNQARRKFFLSKENRENFTFEKGRLYQGDFYNPYIDFGNFALKLPGFSLNVIKYVDQKSHCLRYVFKNRETGDIFININFHLLWGDELEKAMADGDTSKIKGQEQVDAREKQADEHASNRHTDRTARANNDTHMEDGILDHVSQGPSSQSLAPSGGDALQMQLHPGDHRAAAQAPSNDLAMGATGHATIEAHQSENITSPQVDEIANLLQETSTDDQTGKFIGVME